MGLPVYERRYHLGLLVRDIEKKTNNDSNNTKTTNTGKGKRSTTISGSALKNKFGSGEIPLN